MQALNSDEPIRCKTLFISDVHLGSHHCKAEKLLQFLEAVECEQLYLVGDIVDVWAMHKRVYWPKTHNKVLSKLMKMSKKGVDVIYIPGNHDENFREFCGSEFGDIKIRRDVIHTTAKGQRMLVIHGDELDYSVRYSRLNRLVGDFAYDALMAVNRWVNRWREMRGKPYWSLAKWIKCNVAQAERAINTYQEAAVNLARHKKVDGIICGHLHYPVVKQYDDILYCNDGDWVENCTALLEDASGELRLIQALGHSTESKERILLAAA